MNERAIRVLEYATVIEEIEHYAACSLGKARIAKMVPYTLLAEAEMELSAVDECLQFVYRFGSLPYGGITDIRALIQKAAIGGILRGEDLNAIADFIAGGRRVRETIQHSEETLPLNHLNQSAARLFDARQTELEIRQTIDEDGSVFDNASPTLRRLRTSRRQAEARARQVLEQMLHTHQRYLQDPVIAMRGNSLCLPVRVEYKNLVHGLIHDYSASGATVFIEPQAAVQLTAEAQALLLEEEREIEKILQQVSAAVATVAAPLAENVDVLGEIDAWFAKAEHAKEHRCERPRLRTDGVWNLVGARHPLLDASRAVPIDIALGTVHSMVVVTGPNTGGKTVALKTVGLLTLLAMSGCFLPTRENSEIGWCDEVFVDIGDEQSIQQSLSTFSSHLTNIVQILQKVTPNSLILLDELGAGTDPAEGAALAISILDYLNGFGCRVLATTHYAELKGYAFTEPKAINASVEFDVETLRPTYRLLVGVPGRSNALAIAARLGLSDSIINRARALASEGDERTEQLLLSIETANREIEIARAAAMADRDAAAQLRETLESERAKFETELERLRTRAVTEAKSVVEKAQSEASRVISELRRRQKSGPVKDHELVALRKSLETALPEEDPRHTSRPNGNQHVAKGAIVFVTSLGQKGEVLEQSSDGKNLVVQLGQLRTKVRVSDARVLQSHPQPEPFTTSRRGLMHTVGLELDIRGETVDDATLKLDKYLDDAIMSGLARVTIIHGKGTGALRDGVRRYLASHKRVVSWASGAASEGGAGVTVVQLQ